MAVKVDGLERKIIDEQNKNNMELLIKTQGLNRKSMSNKMLYGVNS